MRWIRAFELIWVMLFSTAIGVACSSVDPSNPYDPSAPATVQARGEISGRVLGPDAAPLAGVTVSFEGMALTGATDADGAYTLTDVPHGSRTLVASLSGYRTALLPVLDLALGEKRTLPDITLERARGQIRGHLTVTGPSPVEFGSIRARLSDGNAALDVVTPDDAAFGNEADFTVSDVLAGTQTLTFVVPGFTAPPVEGVVVPPDGVVELPNPVQIAPVPVPLVLDVLSPSPDEPLPADLQVSLTQSGVESSVGIGDDGRFHPIAPHAGLATLHIAYPAFQHVERTFEADAPPPDSPAAEAPAPQALDPIQLAYAYGRLTGQIQTEDCAPHSVPVTVSVDTGTTQAAALVTVPGSDTQGCSPGATGGTATFELPNLRAGSYTLRVASEDYVTANSEAPVTVVEDVAVAHPKFALAVAYGSLSGDVRTPLDGTADFDRSGTEVTVDGLAQAGASDAAGHFEIPTIRPGIYGLVVQRPDGSFQDLRLSAVVVRPGTDTALGDLGLAFATGRIHGRVTLATGASTDGVDVQLNGPESDTIRLNGSDEFLFADKRTGTYRVTASKYGFAPVAVEVVLSHHLDDQATNDLVLPLQPGRIIGTVEYQPVAGEAIVPQVSVVGHPAVAVVPAGDPALGLPSNSFVLGDLTAGTYTVAVAFPPRYRSRTLPGILVEPNADTSLTGIQLDRASGSVAATFTLADAAALTAEERTRLLSTVQVRLDSETGGLSYTSLSDGQGHVVFPSVLVDRYTLTATLPDYLPSVTSGVEVAADLEARVIAEALELPLNPGHIRGHVAFADRADDGTGIEVEVLGTAVRAVTAADGNFDLTGLKAGVYAVTFSGGVGYRDVTVSPIIVVAGEESALADTVLPPAYGDMAGTVALEGRTDASGAVVQVLSGAGADTVVANALVNADGSFQVPSVRVGQYTVVAHHPDYIDQMDNGVAVSVDQTTPLAFHLSVNRGSLSGRVTLSDGVDITGAGVVVTLEQTGDTLVPAPDGGFVFEDLAPGVYSVLAVADGYAPTNTQPVSVDPGADASFAAPVVLLDIKAPEAPSLVACTARDPLPDFPDAPVFVRTQAVGVLGARYYPVVVALDPSVAAESSPLADANFDPAARRGHWEWRGAVGAWQPVPAADIDVYPQAGCAHNFTVPLKTENSVATVEIRAVDADGNVGNSGLLLVVGDTRAPGWFRTTLEGGHCPNDPDQVDVPAAGQLPPSPGLSPPVSADPIPVCHIADTTAQLHLRPTTGEASFGCYYVYSNTWPPPGANGAPPVIPTPAQVVSALVDARGELNLDAFDTTVCLPAGTQSITVTPGSQDTLYCVVGVDQARRYAPMGNPCVGNADCGAGNTCDLARGVCVKPDGTDLPPAVLANCLVVKPDVDAPIEMDVFPDGAEVRGGRATFYTTDTTTALDPHFDHFEVQGPGGDPTWRTITPADVGDMLAFPVNTIPGESNTFQFRGVDQAGNEGVPVAVTVEDTTVEPIDVGDAAVGAAPSLVGERVAWSRPLGCDPAGVSKVCSNDLQVMDDSGLLPETGTVTELHTCAFGCPSGVGGRTPLVALMPHGVAFADYSQTDTVVRLAYIHFGPDGKPATADDGRRAACTADPECSVVVTGSTCSAVDHRCTLPAPTPAYTYLANIGATAYTQLSSPATNGAVMKLASNEVQVASAELLVSGIPPNEVHTWTLRRFQVEPNTGWPRNEESLTRLAGQPILQDVTSVAAIGKGTAFTLADGALWFWPSGVVAPFSVPLPTAPGGAGNSIHALAVAGTTRYLTAVLAVYTGLELARGYPTVAIGLDLGPDVDFSRNGNGQIVESFQAPGVACNADGQCDAPEMACITVNGASTCLPQVGYDDPRCPGCASKIVEVSMDNDLLAWTTEAYDADNQPRARVLSWRVGQAGAKPRIVVDRAGRKLSPSVHLDRVAFLDENTGAPTVNVAEPAALGWMLVDGMPKAHPVVGRGWIATSSYSAGLPAVLVAPAAAPASESATLAVSVTENGLATAANIAGQGRGGIALVQAINENRTLRNFDHPLVLASLDAQQHIVLTSTGKGSTLRLAVGPAPAFGFVGAAVTGSDANTPESDLYVAPVSALGPAIAVPVGPTADSATLQTPWSNGRLYDLAGDLLVTVEGGHAGTTHEVVAYDLPYLDPTVRGVTCDTPACLNAHRRSLQASAVVADSFEDIATDGRHTVWAVTGSTNTLYFHDTVGGVITVDQAVKCRHVAVTTTQPSPNTTAIEVACVGFANNRNDNNDQFVKIYRRTGNAGAFPAGNTVTLTLPSASGGPVVGLWLNDTDLVIERQEDGLQRVFVRNAGPDGVFGTAANSDDIPSAAGALLAGSTSPFDQILGRNGDDPGVAGLYHGQFVYSDRNGIGQAEIYRLRLRGRQVDRLTHDGNTQNAPGMGEAGLAFVDERYTVTAQGKPITPPAITFRSQP